MECCGFEGPKEFAYNNEPIDDSCYDDVNGTNGGIVDRREDVTTAKRMKQVKLVARGRSMSGWLHNRWTCIGIEM